MGRSFKPKKEMSAEDHNDLPYQQAFGKNLSVMAYFYHDKTNCSCLITSQSPLITLTSYPKAAVLIAM